MILRSLLLGAALSGAAASSAFAADGYFRFPTLAGDQVVFTAEGDLWTAPLAGGRAARLTTHPAEETNAVASPDGTQLAFAASYDGPVEVYVMPVAGGLPRRVTFDGAHDLPVGWTPSGEVLYVGQDPTGPNGARLVSAVDPKSLARHALPLDNANDAAVAADGHDIYFTRYGLAYSGDNVRGYAGGLDSAIWRWNSATGAEAVRLADTAPSERQSNDRRPMPWGDRTYFISDRDGHANLWSMNGSGGDRRQLTRHDGFELRGASLDHGRIVYQLGADLRLYDIAAGEDRALSIELASDFAQRRPHVLKNPLDYFAAASFAPEGNRVVVTARGHAVLLGQGPLRRVDIATPPTARVRYAVLSPDSHWVYAILEGDGADTGGGTAPQIWRFPADGGPAGQQLTKDDAGHRTALALSPDGKLLANGTLDGRLFLLDIEKGENQVIDTAPDADLRDLSWSSDSKHLAFIRSDSAMARSQLFLFEVAGKKTARLTTDRYEATESMFAPDGKFLYFLSDRHFQSSNSGPWGDRNMGPYFDRRTEIFALALQDGGHFPFQPKDELTPPKKDADKKADDKKDDKEKKPEGGPPVEWTGLAERLYQVPLPAENYSALETDGKRLYYLEDKGTEGHKALESLAIDDQAPKPAEFLGDVQEFAFSTDHKKLFVRRWAEHGHAGNMLILDPGEKAPSDLDKSAVRAADWSLEIDPRAEWRQLFEDAWRLHRDFYYDAKMHDVDWAKVRTKFAPLVERVTDRDELNDVLAQMLAELGTLHSQIRPGDLRAASDGGQPGFLGAVLAREPGGARIAHIYRSDPELPADRGPLVRAGVDAREGDLITAVNGRPVAGTDDIAQLLAGTANQQVLLTLDRTDAKDKKAPPHTVKTVALAVDAGSNARLRYGDWEESRRDAVAKASNGQIGYLHLRAMTREDIDSFARDFYAEYDRGGLIIDARHNNGGNIDSWVIEKLLRRAWAYWTPRYSTRHASNMQQTFRGHLAVLVDATTYSDGETFAAGVKALKLAPLIGKRTAGAGVWLSDNTDLADHGEARTAETPQFAIGTGEWLVENKGVEPDITVENPPNASFKGGDAQLDAAVKLLLDKLAKEPVKPL